MLLGKRPRPPMKRTTSMSDITFDLNTPTDGMDGGGAACPSWWKQPQPSAPLDQSRVLATVSPRNYRRQYNYSSDLEHTTPDFLRACSLCKRRLVPGRDIYMYRGDSAFCSLECRQQQMNQDERKEKCCVASKKQVVATPSGSQVAT